MIELDVDMGYLLEVGEPDCVTLNDENGEFESMTFYRGDTDAVAFCKRVESAVRERKPLTLFGVDYETVCDVPFCEQVDRWLHGDAPSECRECPDGKYRELTALVDGGTRYYKLFGTPERAARVIAALNNCRVTDCIDCWARGACRYYGCGDDYDALLEWLRGEGAAE